MEKIPHVSVFGIKLFQLSFVSASQIYITLTKGYSCKIAQLKINSQDCLPISPGDSFNQTFTMQPLAQVCDQGRGLVLDAVLSRERDEANLASSSIPESGNSIDLFGIVVSYTIKVTMNFSGLARKLDLDIPFKLNHPKPSKCIQLQWCSYQNHQSPVFDMK